MLLSKTRQQEIDQEIDKIFINTQSTYPETSLLDIVKKLGIDVYQYDFGANSSQISGAIIRGDNTENPQIIINKHEHRERKVFTIAHELGHFILHDKNEQFRVDKYNYNSNESEALEETEANYFAASLLMPKDKFLEIIQLTNNTEAVSKYFGVSVAAIANRIKWIRSNN